MDAEEGPKDDMCLLCLDELSESSHVIICTKGCSVHLCPACVCDAYIYGKCLYCKELVDRILNHEGKAIGVTCPKCQARALKMMGLLIVAKALMHILLF